MGRVLNRGVKRALPAAVAVAALSLTPCGVAAAQTKASALTEPAPIAGINYGPLLEEVLTVFPANAAGSTSVLLVHGGGWRTQRSETELPGIAEELQRAGFTVFDVDYPQDSSAQPAFPLEPNAIKHAVEWVGQNAASFQGSASNIVLVGGSAGGQLVEMTAARLQVQGVVSLSGPTNIVSLTSLARAGELKDGLGGDVRIAAGCGSSFGGCSESVERTWSPIDNVPASCPPYLLFGSELDEVPVNQQLEFKGTLDAAGCRANLTILGSNLHSFQYWPKVRTAVVAFIAAH